MRSMRQTSIALFIFILLFWVGEKISAADDGYRLSDSKREELIEKGLSYLASQQKRDGFWNNTEKGEQYSTAITALSGLAFLAKGYFSNRGPYQSIIKKTTDFLISAQRKEDGLIAMPGENRPMYGHGFATLYLCQIYGMTKDQGIKHRLKEALSLIIKNQNKKGGWDYEPYSKSDEGSITIVQIQALRGCRDAGTAVSVSITDETTGETTIKTPADTVKKALDYVKKSQYHSSRPENEPEKNLEAKKTPAYAKELEQHPPSKNDPLNDGGIAYQTGPLGEATPALTAAGMAVLFNSGEYQLSEIHQRGFGYLDRNLSSLVVDKQPHFMYTNFYAAQVYKQRGGAVSKLYFSQIEPILFKKANCNDRFCNWDIDHEGIIYATAMALLILEMPLDLVPIFEN